MCRTLRSARRRPRPLPWPAKLQTEAQVNKLHQDADDYARRLRAKLDAARDNVHRSKLCGSIKRALSSALAKRRKPLFAASDNFAQRFFTWFAEISEVTFQAGFNAAASWLNTCAILFDVGRTLFGDCSGLEHDGQAVF